MPNAEINHNSHLPFFTEELLSYLPEKLPIGSIPFHTYLSNLEDPSTVNLNQKQAEKAISILLGFEQPREFTRVERGTVKQDEDGNNRIYLDSDQKDCVDAECAMEKILADGNSLIGLRVIKAYAPNGPDAPYLRFDNLKHPGLIRARKNGPIKGINLKLNNNQDHVRYRFELGDKIEIFTDPKSISAKLYNPNNNKTENIFLGGGFTFQLHNYDVANNVLTALVEITSNNHDIRFFSKEDTIPYQHSFTINLKKDNQDGGLHLLTSHPVTKSLAQLHHQNMFDHVREVVESFVNRNPKALAKMANLTLSLHPALDTHAMKCKYATILDESGNPKIITYAFDLESAVHTKEQWVTANNKNQNNDQPIYHSFDATNHRLTKVINRRQALWQEPSLSMRYLSSLLVKGGIIQTNLEPISKMFRFMKDIKGPIANLQELITQFEQTVAINSSKTSHLHLQKKSKKLAGYTRNLPHEFKINTEVSSDYPPSRILGEIIASAYPNIKQDPNWSVITTYKNQAGSIEIIVRRDNPQQYLINLDSESRLRFCVPVNNYTIPSEFISHFKSRHDSIEVVKKTLNLLNLPAVPDVYYSDAREGD